MVQFLPSKQYRTQFISFKWTQWHKNETINKVKDYNMQNKSKSA